MKLESGYYGISNPWITGLVKEEAIISKQVWIAQSGIDEGLIEGGQL
jgi:hypothetical protein